VDCVTNFYTVIRKGKAISGYSAYGAGSYKWIQLQNYTPISGYCSIGTPPIHAPQALEAVSGYSWSWLRLCKWVQLGLCHDDVMLWLREKREGGGFDKRAIKCVMSCKAAKTSAA
jgi:hypothetical protein